VARVAAADWVRHLRAVHFDAGMVEPVRVLGETPAASGLTDILLRTGEPSGLVVVIEALLRSHLGPRLRGLHFRVGYEGLDDLLDALADGEGMRLERLALAVMGLTDEHIFRLCGGPLLPGLTALDLRDNPLGKDGIRTLAAGLRGSNLEALNLAGTSPSSDGLEAMGRCAALTGLRQLDLSRNPLTPRSLKVLSLSRCWPAVRSV